MEQMRCVHGCVSYTCPYTTITSSATGTALPSAPAPQAAPGGSGRGGLRSSRRSSVKSSKSRPVPVSFEVSTVVECSLYQSCTAMVSCASGRVRPGPAGVGVRIPK